MIYTCMKCVSGCKNDDTEKARRQTMTEEETEFLRANYQGIIQQIETGSTLVQ